jgi:arsenite oxidase small subunit
MKDNSNSDDKTGFSRRQMLSLSLAAGVAAGTGGASEANSQPSPSDAKAPELEIGKLDDIKPGTVVEFDYPDDNSPAILLRLDGPVEGGVGPDQSIVAFSRLCTHKGCPLDWNADQKMLICPCHWSSFDPALKGRMIIGQASQGLPQITLRISEGNIRAVGVEGLIYGRYTNIL